MLDSFEKRNIVTITTPSIISDTRESRKAFIAALLFYYCPASSGLPRTDRMVVLSSNSQGHVLQLSTEVLDYDTGDYLLSSHTSARAHNLPLS
jgi:hypothetical protein